MNAIICHICGLSLEAANQRMFRLTYQRNGVTCTTYSCNSHDTNDDRRALGLRVRDEENDDRDEAGNEITSTQEYEDELKVHQLMGEELAQLIKEGDPMTAKPAEAIYERAAQQNIIVKNLACAGRTWTGFLLDGHYPARPGQLSTAQADTFKDFLTIWGTLRRDEWLAEYNATAPAPTGPPVVLELPANDDDAYEAGYNAGLTVGMSITAPPAPVSTTTPPAAADISEYWERIQALQNTLAASEQCRFDAEQKAQQQIAAAQDFYTEASTLLALAQGERSAKERALFGLLDTLRQTRQASERIEEFLQDAENEANLGAKIALSTRDSEYAEQSPIAAQQLLQIMDAAIARHVK